MLFFLLAQHAAEQKIQLTIEHFRAGMGPLSSWRRLNQKWRLRRLGNNIGNEGLRSGALQIERKLITAQAFPTRKPQIVAAMERNSVVTHLVNGRLQ